MENTKITQPDVLPSLDQGLYLENIRELLPWYITHRAARMILGLEDARPDKDTLS